MVTGYASFVNRFLLLNTVFHSGIGLVMQRVLGEILHIILFEPKSIGEYQNHNKAPTILILLALAMTIGFVSPIEGASVIGNYSFFIFAVFLNILVAAIFFQYWFRVKGIQTEPEPLCLFFALALAINNLTLPSYKLANYFDSMLFFYANSTLITYSFIVLIYGLAKSVNSSLGFVFLGLATCSVLLFFSLAILQSLFIFYGFLPIPLGA